MIYGIDFDGTIVEEKFPAIGKPIARVVEFIRDLQAKGHKWVLITMREGKYLDDALEWLKAQGLTPDAVNDNLPERVAKWGNNPRKVYADIYIDDHNAGGVYLPGENPQMYDEDVGAYLHEVTEDVTGYIGQWLDEKPDFMVSDALNFMSALEHNIKAYLGVSNKGIDQ